MAFGQPDKPYTLIDTGIDTVTSKISREFVGAATVVKIAVEIASDTQSPKADVTAALEAAGTYLRRHGQKIDDKLNDIIDNS